MSSSKVANIRNLFAGLQRTDAKSYEGLMQILFYLENIENTLFPIVAEFNAPSVVVPAPPTNFSYTIQSNGILFTWAAPASAVSFYELRLGTDWDTATFILRTSSLNALIPPVVAGTYTYLLRSLSSSGEYSETVLSSIVTIIGPGIVPITATVIDNNVLLYWNQPTTQFAISYYAISRDGVPLGTVTSTFMPVTQVASGLYTFGIYAVDIAGNFGPLSTVGTEVAQPPDYVLEDTFLSNLIGTRVNCYRFT